MATKWYDPRTWKKEPSSGGISITIPDETKITQPSGEVLTGRIIKGVTVIESSTGQTTSVKDVNTGKNVPVSSSPSSSPKSSKPIQGPVPQGTTPQEEQTFRETGETPSAQRIQPATKDNKVIYGEVSATTDKEMRTGYQERYTTSGWDAFKFSVANVFKGSTWKESKEDKLTRARTITDTTGPKIEQPSRWKNIIEPFSFTKDRGSQIAPSYEQQRFGTVNVFEQDKTRFDVAEQKLSEPEFKLISTRMKYQADVDAGKITIEEASEGYKRDTSNARRDIDKINRQTSNLYSSPTYEKLEKAPSYIETGGVIAGSFLAPQIVGPYLLGSGLYQGSKLAQKEKEGYEISFSEKLSAGSRIGFGFSSIATPSIKIGESITRTRIAEGVSSPAVSRTNVFGVDDKGVRTGVTITQRQTPYYEEFSKATFRIKQSPTGTSYDILGGTTGKTTVRYVDFMKQIRNEPSLVSSTQTFGGVGRVDIGTIGEQSAFVSRGLWVDQTGKPTTTLVGGPYRTSQADPTKAFSIQGDVSALTFEFTGRKTAQVNIANLRDFGLTKDRTLLVGDSFKSFGARGSGGSGKPFSEVIQKQTTQGFSISTPSFAPPVTTTKPFGGVIFSGSTFTETKQKTKTTPRFTTNQIQEGAFEPVSDVEQKNQGALIFDVPTRTRGRSGNKIDFRPITTPQLDVRLDETTEQPPRFVRPFIPPITLPKFSPTFTPTGGGGFGVPPIVLPFGGERGLRLSDFGARRSYSYTPSFKAIVFGIRGKQPTKTRFTGLEVRPIVGGSVFGGRKRRREDLFKFSF